MACKHVTGCAASPDGTHHFHYPAGAYWSTVPPAGTCCWCGMSSPPQMYVPPFTISCSDAPK
jgi:hypothetical protein